LVGLQLAPLVTTLAATGVPAAAGSVTAPEPPPRVTESSFFSGTGVAGGKTQAGLGLSGLGTHRVSYFEFGLELNMSLLFSAMLGVGALAGVHVGDDFSLRVLSTGGVHHYLGVGRDLLSDDPGASGSTPYVGARVVLAYRWRVSSVQRRPFFGLMGGLDQDLDQRDVTVRYSDDYYTPPSTSRHHLGQTTYTGLFVAGLELDLAPY
jgi:hypothetical protein